MDDGRRCRETTEESILLWPVADLPDHNKSMWRNNNNKYTYGATISKRDSLECVLRQDVVSHQRVLGSVPHVIAGAAVLFEIRLVPYRGVQAVTLHYSQKLVDRMRENVRWSAEYRAPLMEKMGQIRGNGNGAAFDM